MVSAKRALITGGTANLGLAIAQRFAADGYDLVLNYTHNAIRAEGIRPLLEGSGVSVRLVRADVTQPEDVSRLFHEAAAGGSIDVLVNNVGGFLFKPFLDTSLGEWEQVLSSNLTSAMLCCREVLPGMRDRGSGSIVNIASMHAERLRATPNTLPYAIAKSGVVALTKTLAKTEGPYGIRVNTVCPGFLDTEDSHNPPGAESRIPLRRFGRPEEIAAIVAFLASDDASYVTGAVLNAHGGALL